MKNKCLTILGLLTLSLSSFASAGEGPSTPITFKNVTTYVARTSADPTRPLEIVTDFESVFPVDVVLDMNFIGEETDATIVVSGAFYGNHDSSLKKSWQAAKPLSQMYKVKLKKGTNRITVAHLNVKKAAEEYIDNRKRGAKVTSIGLTFSVFVKDKEVGSKQVTYSAHLQ